MTVDRNPLVRKNKYGTTKCLKPVQLPLFENTVIVKVREAHVKVYVKETVSFGKRR